MRPTHTYALAYISKPAFDEIKAKLESAGYQHAILDDGRETVLDMTGIGLAAKPDIEGHDRDQFSERT